MSKLIYLISCTVDRFIARKDGSFDFFLMEGEHVADLLSTFPETIPDHLRGMLGITVENQHFDSVLMGRRTYEVGVKEGITNPYPHMKQYLFSRTLQQSPDPAVELVSSDPATFVQALKQRSGKDIWLCGGGDLATVLFPAIDEVVLKVHPFLLGSGIPLFSGKIPLTSLEFTDSKIYKNGFMLLHYQVNH
ncbi:MULTISPECIES: dihydrofolate reductase family protein [Leptolyngbya]|uniref:Dihydrofolate reductase family protein n=1 Tax=Leptolyngbya boryana CZ1 TaxID=3060204 RepID=A0AA96WN81_LEPBY|nr:MULTISPECIES: dihydrofolate reductase family protein [Leptolyngbya]MCY6493433.1 dihydrofolate reductase family protein [Leptolyngbya sp. GGD]WNZ43215.1 dihydrofolate reductase family protein [Leptolyngbya boryana CZ1]